LAIGYNIVDSMGGRIVASNGPQGARFEVWLPVADQLDIVEPVAQTAPLDRAKRKTVAS
jgi:K+-sensing histidine kinase KdpD